MTAASAVIAIDVGGTAIKAQLVTPDGRALRSDERATPRGDPPAAVQSIRDVARDLAALPDVATRAVGVVVPGTVDAQSGIARYSANIGWRDVPLAQLLHDDLTMPVALGHDVSAAALAERELGAAAGQPDCAVVVIGTGIAAVSTIGGAVRRGATASAGELGHVPVRPGGVVCACGQRGCVEAYASARAIANRYAAVTGEQVSGRDVAARVPHDDVAARVWQEAVDALADGLVALTMIDDPTSIVVAGGLSDAGDTLLRPLRAALDDRLTWRAAPRLDCSPLGAFGGRVGAALLAWQLVGAGQADLGVTHERSTTP